MARTLYAAAALALTGLLARAGEGRAETGQRTVIDSGLVVGLPAALPTGLSTGVGAGISHGGALAWGARASWSSATEYALSWTVRHDDVRLRLFAAWQHDAGRGQLALRLGAGGTLVREARTRDQGSRAGLSGDDLETTSWALLPAADLEAVVVLRVVGSWGLALSGGPSVDYHDGGLHAGWLGTLGVAWQQ